MAYAKSANFINTEDSNNPLWIEQNHEDWDDRDSGVYIHGGSEFATYSVEDIPRMIETLQAIYDSFEAVKPEEPTVRDILDPLPNGAIIRFRAEQTTWIKVNGEWLHAQGRFSLATSILRDRDAAWNTIVVYNPEEEN